MAAPQGTPPSLSDKLKSLLGSAKRMLTGPITRRRAAKLNAEANTAAPDAEADRRSNDAGPSTAGNQIQSTPAAPTTRNTRTKEATAIDPKKKIQTGRRALQQGATDEDHTAGPGPSSSNAFSQDKPSQATTTDAIANNKTNKRQQSATDAADDSLYDKVGAGSSSATQQIATSRRGAPKTAAGPARARDRTATGTARPGPTDTQRRQRSPDPLDSSINDKVESGSSSPTQQIATTRRGAPKITASTAPTDDESTRAGPSMITQTKTSTNCGPNRASRAPQKKTGLAPENGRRVGVRVAGQTRDDPTTSQECPKDVEETTTEGPMAPTPRTAPTKGRTKKNSTEDIKDHRGERNTNKERVDVGRAELHTEDESLNEDYTDGPAPSHAQNHHTTRETGGARLDQSTRNANAAKTPDTGRRVGVRRAGQINDAPLTSNECPEEDEETTTEIHSTQDTTITGTTRRRQQKEERHDQEEKEELGGLRARPLNNGGPSTVEVPNEHKSSHATKNTTPSSSLPASRDANTDVPSIDTSSRMLKQGLGDESTRPRDNDFERNNEMNSRGLENRGADPVGSSSALNGGTQAFTHTTSGPAPPKPFISRIPPPSTRVTKPAGGAARPATMTTAYAAARAADSAADAAEATDPPPSNVEMLDRRDARRKDVVEPRTDPSKLQREGGPSTTTTEKTTDVVRTERSGGRRAHTDAKGRGTGREAHDRALAKETRREEVKERREGIEKKKKNCAIELKVNYDEQMKNFEEKRKQATHSRIGSRKKPRRSRSLTRNDELGRPSMLQSHMGREVAPAESIEEEHGDKVPPRRSKSLPGRSDLNRTFTVCTGHAGESREGARGIVDGKNTRQDEKEEYVNGDDPAGEEQSMVDFEDDDRNDTSSIDSEGDYSEIEIVEVDVRDRGREAEDGRDSDMLDSASVESTNGEDEEVDTSASESYYDSDDRSDTSSTESDLGAREYEQYYYYDEDEMGAVLQGDDRVTRSERSDAVPRSDFLAMVECVRLLFKDDRKTVGDDPWMMSIAEVQEWMKRNNDSLQYNGTMIEESFVRLASCLLSSDTNAAFHEAVQGTQFSTNIKLWRAFYVNMRWNEKWIVERLHELADHRFKAITSMDQFEAFCKNTPKEPAGPLRELCYTAMQIENAKGVAKWLAYDEMIIREIIRRKIKYTEHTLKEKIEEYRSKWYNGSNEKRVIYCEGDDYVSLLKSSTIGIMNGVIFCESHRRYVGKMFQTYGAFPTFFSLELPGAVFIEIDIYVIEDFLIKDYSSVRSKYGITQDIEKFFGETIPENLSAGGRSTVLSKIVDGRIAEKKRVQIWKGAVKKEDYGETFKSEREHQSDVDSDNIVMSEAMDQSESEEVLQGGRTGRGRKIGKKNN